MPEASRARPPVKRPRYSAKRSAENWSTAIITISFGAGVAAVTFCTGGAESCARLALAPVMQSAVARAAVRYFSFTGGFSGQRVSARAVLSTKAAYMASLRPTNSCGRAMNLLREAFVTRIGRALLAVLALTRSEEHTSELQSLMRISYAVFCFK